MKRVSRSNELLDPCYGNLRSTNQPLSAGLGVACGPLGRQRSAYYIPPSTACSVTIINLRATPNALTSTPYPKLSPCRANCSLQRVPKKSAETAEKHGGIGSFDRVSNGRTPDHPARREGDSKGGGTTEQAGTTAFGVHAGVVREATTAESLAENGMEKLMGNGVGSVYVANYCVRSSTD
ncbi:hypothetical protein DMN91_002178 [Ooceraea biroi]|uniref:Uncharacterized protein n=1 Tax=Ooceraea biroi TaxID=2015173 RepID=A0A3L8E0V5_OOCBI|nr:hypothetical protein DMN91_002178 [Ooceraea biroi]